MGEEEFLLAEYKHFSDSFWKNEEVGEKRVNFFITLTTAILAGIVALVTSKNTWFSDVEVRRIVTVALIGTFLFGLVTFFRILQRNRVTDEYKDIIDYLRERLRKLSPRLSEYKLPFQPSSSRMFRGGLAETVAVINSFVIAVIASLWFGKGWNWLAASCSFLVAFFLQELVAGNERKKRRKDKSRSQVQKAGGGAGITGSRGTIKSRSQTYRAGVGAVITGPGGHVLALERSDVPGAWQLPQGGLIVGEEPLKAVKREILEETGIKGSDLQLLSTESRLLAYELPEEYRSKKTGRGQVQRWFLFCYKGPDEAITLGDREEFKDWRWMPMDELVSTVVPFRKSVYLELAEFLSSQPRDFA